MSSYWEKLQRNQQRNVKTDNKTNKGETIVPLSGSKDPKKEVERYLSHKIRVQQMTLLYQMQKAIPQNH